jgi:branched-chain amino acid transport system permease protein
MGVATLVGIWSIAVLGLSLLTGFTGLFSFGHAAFMAIGGYTSAILMIRFNVPFILSVPLGGLAATIVSYFIGRLTLNLKGDYFCIATLGFGEATRLVLDNVREIGNFRVGGAMGLPDIPRYTTLPLVIIINIIGIVILARIVRSRQGRNMIAIREEELASQTIGINVFRHKVHSFMISACYAGVAGALFASHMGFLQPRMFNLVRSTELTIMVIFGGLGSISGSVLGAVVLGSMPEVLREFADWRLVIYGALVVFIMIVRPSGLMGGKEFSLSFLKRFRREK